MLKAVNSKPVEKVNEKVNEVSKDSSKLKESIDKINANVKSKKQPGSKNKKPSVNQGKSKVVQK